MHQGPPQTNGYLPTVVIGIVSVFPCCGFITLDLLCLNYKSQLKLESSCHCPDMWLVGVIVFFISLIPHTPLSALPKASLSKGSFLPHFHTATATPKPPVLSFQVSPVGYITTPFPVAERRQNSGTSCNPFSRDCQQGNNFSLAIPKYHAKR